MYTSSFQVDIFLYRAQQATDKRIYCLAHVELLGFDVCGVVRDSLERIIHSKTGLQAISFVSISLFMLYCLYSLKYDCSIPDFRLLVLCSSECEEKSPIATMLDRFKVPAPYMDRMENIHKYMKAHFLVFLICCSTCWFWVASNTLKDTSGKGHHMICT